MAETMSCYTLILVLLYVTYIQAYRPEGYIGCFHDWRQRILEGKYRASRTNCGDECILYCKEDGYRYAGTENSYECFCGHRLRVEEKASACNYVCGGNYNEICGGHWRISVYDIWSIKEDTTASMLTSQITKRETTTRKTVTRQTTRKPTTSLPITSTYITSSEGISNGSTQTIVNTSEMKVDSGKSMIAVYVAVPVGVAFLILILFVGVLIRKRQGRRKKTLIEQFSQGTGSVPNIYANSIVSNNEPSDSAIKANVSDGIGTDDMYTVTYETNAAEGGHITQANDETDTYNTLRKQHKNCEITDNPYNHVSNAVNDEAYSVCSRNQSSNGQRGTNNIYAHIKDAVNQTNCTRNADNGDGVYNILQLKSDLHHETSKQAAEISDYDTTNIALSLMGSDGDYSYMNEVAMKLFYEKDKYFNTDNIYYNDNEYASVEAELNM